MSSRLYDMYLEGTEDILNEFTKKDKQIILKTVSNIRINSYNISNQFLLYNIKPYLSLLDNKDLDYIINTMHKALVFYYNNLPNGFYRLKGYHEIVNERGLILRFNRRVVTCRLNSIGKLEVTLTKVTPIKHNKLFTNTLHSIAYIINTNDIIKPYNTEVIKALPYLR